MMYYTFGFFALLMVFKKLRHSVGDYKAKNTGKMKMDIFLLSMMLVVIAAVGVGLSSFA